MKIQNFHSSSFRIGLGLWLSVSASVGQASYTVNIDTFSTSQHVDTGTTNPASNDLTVSSLFDSAGAIRTLYLSTSIGDFSQSLDVDSGLFPGFLSLQTAVISTSMLTYNDIGGTGGAFDLTTGGATHFLVDLQTHDQSGNWVLDVTDSDGHTATRTLTQSAISSPETLSVAYSSFTDTGAGVTDFDKVTSFQLEIAGDALDYKIGVFGAGTIPEPSTGVISVFGALLLCTQRRRTQEVLSTIH